MYFRKIAGFLLLLTGTGCTACAQENKYVQSFRQLTEQSCTDRTCADSLFRLLYILSYEKEAITDSLSRRFTAYAAQFKQQPYLMAKASLMGAYTNCYIRNDLPAAFKDATAAIRFFEKEPAGKDLCFAYQLLSYVYQNTNNFKLAHETNLKALKIARQLDIPVLIANSYNDLGIDYNQENKYDKAKLVFLNTVALLEPSGDTATLAQAYLNVATACRNLEEYDSAFYYNEKGLKLAEQINHRSYIAYAYNDIGSFYVFRKQYALAVPYLKKAKAIREALNEPNELFWTYIFMGDSYTGMHQHSLGKQFYHKAIQLAASKENTPQLYEACLRLSAMYAGMHQFDSAYFYNNRYSLLKDSVMQAKKDLAADIFIASYELGEKEQQIQLLDEEMKNSRMKLQQQRLLLIFSLFIALVLLAVILLARKLKKQQFGRLLLEKQLAEESAKRVAEENLRKEKERIAGDLHDNVGSQLSFIIHSLDGINQDNAEKRAVITQNITRSVRSVIRNLRETIWLISDSNTRLQDFSDKLKVFVRDLFRLSDIKIDFTENIQEDTELNSLLSLNLYRICQEILTNAFKHSQAQNVRINLSFDKHTLSIKITDDGIGCRLANTHPEGYGLRNIHKRAQESDITVACTSAIEGGTEYVVFITVNS